MEWQPPNLNQICPQHSNLTACSYLGYFFLNFLVNLFNEDDRNKWANTDEERQISDNYEVYGKYRDDFEDDGIKEAKFDEEYDFIVVGAGTAGCVVANRLTEIKHWKVLLLEAGPEQPAVTLVPGLSTVLAGSSVDWGYSLEPNGKSCLSRTQQKCVWPRGKMMGGSSSINTMVYVVGNRADYDGWAALGNKGWSYEEILPYIRKYENNLDLPGLNRKYHGIHGPQFISRFPFIDEPSIILTEAFHQLGLPILDFNGAEQEGTMQAQVYAANGMRISTNTAYIDPIRRKRKNLTVKTDAQVIKVLVDDHKVAYGVEYVKNGHIYKAKAKKEVIVSCGTVESPKLLMLSGIGPKEHLEDVGIPVVKDLPVGDNLHDHVTFTAYVVGFRNDSITRVSFKRMLELIQDYKEALIKRGPIASTGPFNSVSLYRTSHDFIAPDIQIQTYDLRDWREFVAQPSEYMNVDIFPSVFYDAVIPRVQNLVPKSRGYLRLNASNPYGAPIIQANLLGDPQDAETLKAGTKQMLQLEKTETFKSGKAFFIKKALPACNHLKWGSDEYTDCVIRHYTFALNHQVGSCTMGPDPDYAVVDPKLRVFGVKGLRVIDASIMPVVPRGNTNSPTTMVGEKGSDMIKEDWLNM